MRRMRARPISQLVGTVIADVLLIVNGVIYLQKGGLPILSLYLLILILLCGCLVSLRGSSKAGGK